MGDFYKHVNKKLSSRGKIGSLKTSNGDIVQNDIDKANVLNDYFTSVCTQDDGNTPPFVSLVAGDDGISTVVFDETKLHAAVRRIKTKRPTSCGPDGYPVTNVSVDTRKYFFSNRVVRVWNELPLTVDFCSLCRFKSTTYHLDLTKYCINLQNCF